MPRMIPMPTPLAIPLSKLFRAHGISWILFISSRGDILFLGHKHGRGGRRRQQRLGQSRLLVPISVVRRRTLKASFKSPQRLPVVSTWYTMRFGCEELSEGCLCSDSVGGVADMVAASKTARQSAQQSHHIPIERSRTSTHEPAHERDRGSSRGLHSQSMFQ